MNVPVNNPPLTLRSPLLPSTPRIYGNRNKSSATTTDFMAKSSKKAAKAPKSAKYVYFFGNKKADGNGSMKPLLGGKGANLAEMTRIGLPGASRLHHHHRGLHLLLRQQAHLSQGTLGAGQGRRRQHGEDPGQEVSATLEKPLLVAVRSGARDSMPGMMDTILNLGLNDQTVARPRKSQQQPALRLGLLPPLHPDVWRRRHGRAKSARRRPRTV